MSACTHVPRRARVAFFKVRQNAFPCREMQTSRISKNRQKQQTFRFLLRAAFVNLSVCFSLCPFGLASFLLGAASMRVRLSMKEAARPAPAAALRCLLRLLALQQLSRRVPEALAQRKAYCWPQLWGSPTNPTKVSVPGFFLPLLRAPRSEGQWTAVPLTAGLLCNFTVTVTAQRQPF